MSETPLLRCATPDNCSNFLASDTPRSSIENLDLPAWVCRTEGCGGFSAVGELWTVGKRRLVIRTEHRLEAYIIFAPSFVIPGARR